MSAWMLRTDLDLETLNVHLEALEAAGLLGIAEEDGVATAYFTRRVEELPVAGRWAAVPDVDWDEHWRGHARVVNVGPLAVAPPWLADRAAGDTIVIEPGQAFGTGDHETTAGCLAALCHTGTRGARVLDVGTGTGVLAIAAAKLGAAAVVAVDTDPLAVTAAQRNAATNGVRVEVRQGSVDVVDGAFDVVLANLDTATLAALAPALVERLATGGTLIASGVSVDRRREAVEAFSRAGLAVRGRGGREWVVLAGRRS